MSRLVKGRDVQRAWLLVRSGISVARKLQFQLNMQDSKVLDKLVFMIYKLKSSVILTRTNGLE
jgi:hypothetical protein